MRTLVSCYRSYYRRHAGHPELTKAQALRLAQLHRLLGALNGAPPPAGCPQAGSPDPLRDRGAVSLDDANKLRPVADPASRCSPPCNRAAFVPIGDWR